MRTRAKECSTHQCFLCGYPYHKELCVLCYLWWVYMQLLCHMYTYHGFPTCFKVISGEQWLHNIEVFQVFWKKVACANEQLLEIFSYCNLPSFPLACIIPCCVLFLHENGEHNVWSHPFRSFDLWVVKCFSRLHGLEAIVCKPGFCPFCLCPIPMEHLKSI